MSDASGSVEIETKIKIHNKRNYNKENKQKMIKYYNDPEKQLKLRQRIDEYENQSKIYQLKANELKQYLISPPSE
jgi:hypothetical protein